MLSQQARVPTTSSHPSGAVHKIQVCWVVVDKRKIPRTMAPFYEGNYQNLENSRLAHWDICLMVQGCPTFSLSYH